MRKFFLSTSLEDFKSVREDLEHFIINLQFQLFAFTFSKFSQDKITFFNESRIHKYI